jgi:hypothetical protein
MAVTSSISVDTVGGTITTNIYLNGSTLLDTVIYTNSSGNLSFSGSISAFSVSLADFKTLLNLYIAFNQIIIAVYSPSQFVTTPFSEIVYVQNDTGSLLYFEFMPNSIPLFYYTCSYPSGNIAVTTRALAANLSYAQWLFFLYLLANFKLYLSSAYDS